MPITTRDFPKLVQPGLNTPVKKQGAQKPVKKAKGK